MNERPNGDDRRAQSVKGSGPQASHLLPEQVTFARVLGQLLAERWLQEQPSRAINR
jgi:hypothetical protein